MLLAVAPARAALPGRAGPIAYQKIFTDEAEQESAGGLIARPPRLEGTPWQLTEDPTDASPSYSADGSLIAFESKRHTEGERRGTHIFVMRSDGGEIRQLTGGDRYSDSNPSFSPDGKRIVFERHQPSTRSTHIFAVGLGGGTPRQLTGGRGTDSEPVYAPNGRWIAFASTRHPRGRQDEGDIFSMRPDGSRVRLLVGGRRREFGPDISPDGRRVAFVSNSHEREVNVFVTRVGRRRQRPHRLTHSHGTCGEDRCYTDPSWAPDGRHLAVWRKSRSLHEAVHSTFAVVVVRADGRGREKVFDSGSSQEGCCDFIGPPAWGPRR